MTKTALELIVFGILIGIPCLFFLYDQFKKSKARIPNMIEAEKKRRAHPDIQSGKFTRLYTMPYDENMTGHTIRKYFEEHYPEIYCKCDDAGVWVSESKSGSGEERKMYITQLRSDDVTAIELVDPHEVTRSSIWQRGEARMRMSLYDLGFSDKVREALRAIQAESIARTKR